MSFVKDRDVPGHTARRSRVSCRRALAVGPIALGAFFLLVSSTSLQTAVANGDTRTLSFVHTHRDDSITVTFKRDGRYDEEGLKKLNYFLRDWRTNDEIKMAPGLFDILWEIERDVGTTEAIHIVSSYRSPATNAMLRARSRAVAKHSQHMLGKAIDFNIPGVSIENLRAAGLRLQRGGVGYYPGAFVHVDVGNVRHWPRMPEAQLARILRDGKNRPAPVQTADASGSAGKGRNVLAKLLGIGKDEDEDAGESAAPARGGKPAAAPSAATRVETAAVVPLPRARPAQAGEFQVASAASRPARLGQSSPAPAGEFQLASATSRPARLSEPAPAPAGEFNLASATSRPARLGEPPAPATATASSPMATPNDVINSRGFWREPDEVPLATRQALGSHGERLAWVTGPMGQQIPPRPPADVGTPAAEEHPADTTSSVAAWANNPNHKDRVPPDVALAYAAPPAAGVNAPAKPAAAPMGAAKPSVPVNTAAATVATRRAAVNSPAAKINPRGFDPWLRGIVMTPSVHHSLRVAVLGTVDARGLQPLLHKPHTTLPMVFSNDPTLGLVSLQFTGRAVAFLPTIDVPAARTARLN
jgi:uncharacterized protein YcbK (DUF882 family)